MLMNKIKKFMVENGTDILEKEIRIKKQNKLNPENNKKRYLK